MSYEVSGKIIKIFDEQTFNSGFTKREFVVQTQEQYPQPIKLELYKDKCEILNNFSEGDEVSVAFNLRGNEYKDRFYVNLNAWKIEKQNGSNDAAGIDQSPIPSADDAPPEQDEEFNDLPF